MENKALINICGEHYDLKAALISGKIKDAENSPVSFYFGKLNLEELHTMLYFTNRTVIKMMVNQFDIPLEDTDEFLNSAVNEALVKEQNIAAGSEPDQDFQKMLKRFNNNQ